MKKTPYTDEWLSFLFKHALIGLGIGTITLELNGCLLGAILGGAYAYYRAYKAPGDLTDWQIFQQRNIITPFNPDQIEPDSYDVLLGNHFSKIKKGGEIESWETEEFTIEPGECILAHTKETFEFPNTIKGTLQGKSSWARLALFVECAGLFDKGFKGTAVLELYNASPNKILLKAGDKIAQMSFHRTLKAALPYGHKKRNSHYQEQKGAQISWLTKNEKVSTEKIGTMNA